MIHRLSRNVSTFANVLVSFFLSRYSYLAQRSPREMQKKSGITLKRGRGGKIVEKREEKKRTRGNIGVFPGIKISYCLNRGFSETISRAGVPTSMQRDSGRA